MDNSDPKGRVAQNFWKLIEDRYPVVALWQGRQVAQLFPEWSLVAFQREVATWLSLSQEIINYNDREMLNWGRFARIVAGRLNGEVWRSPVAPLRHVRQVLKTLQILDPSGSRFRSPQVLEQLLGWISRMQDVAGADYWTLTELDMQIRAIKGLIRRLSVPHGDNPSQWTVLSDQVIHALGRYRETIRSAGVASIPPLPMMASAHVDLFEWHRRRTDYSNQSFGTQARPTELEVMELEQYLEPPAHHYQDIMIPGMGFGSYVLSSSDQDLVFYGEKAWMSLILSHLWVWWKRRNPAIHPLSWVLANPVWIEGGLWLGVELFMSQFPGWSPVRAGIFQRWMDQCQLLALADAWLWLESGEPDQVACWLARYLPQEYAYRLVPRLKIAPGRFVSIQMFVDLYHQLGGPSEFTDTRWEEGPFPPEALIEAFYRGNWDFRG